MRKDQNTGDDGVRSATRWVAFGVYWILVPAVIILWCLPGPTHELWAWTIKPDLTPIFLGSSYRAGAYFFWRMFRAKRWNPSSAGVLSAAAFAAAMLVATLIHYNKFNHGHAPPLAAIAFYGWTIVYIISPVVVFWVWIRNQRIDSRTPAPRRSARRRRGAVLALPQLRATKQDRSDYDDRGWGMMNPLSCPPRLQMPSRVQHNAPGGD